METCTGPLVGVDTTVTNGTAEREAAARMLKRRGRGAKSLRVDKNYDAADFVITCRRHKVAPHVATKKSGSAVDG